MAPRSDAEENRARIIEAARRAIAADGELKLNAIAKDAGVGQGTLYRHFPTREDLLAEVYRHDVTELVDSAATLLAEHSPLEALTRWLDRVNEYAQVKRGVFAAVEKSVWQDLSATSLGPIGDALTRLLDAGTSEGTIRSDATADDVILLISFLPRLAPAEATTRGRHLLAIIRDGLRAHPAPAGRRTHGPSQSQQVEP